MATCASRSARHAETQRVPAGRGAQRPLVAIRRRQRRGGAARPWGLFAQVLRGRLAGGGDLLRIFALRFRARCSGAVRSAAPTRRKLPPPNCLRAPVSCRRRDLQSRGARLGDPDLPGVAPVAGHPHQGPSRGTRDAGLLNSREPGTRARDATWAKGDGTKTSARAAWVKGPQHMREVAARPRPAGMGDLLSRGRVHLRLLWSISAGTFCGTGGWT